MDKMPCVRLFQDLNGTTDLLSDAEAGRLLKALMHYINGKEDNLSGREQLVFAMLKAQIERDAASYTAYADKQRENGKKGGRPKKTETQKTQRFFDETHENPKNLEYESEYESESESEGVVNAPAPADMPFGLTDAEIDASLSRDQAIEQAARDAGLPFFPRNIETARDLANDYGMEWLLEAIKRTADGKSQTWGYVKGILRSWKERGGMDAESRPKPANDSKRVTAQNYTQRNYTDEELNSQTAALLREAMEL